MELGWGDSAVRAPWLGSHGIGVGRGQGSLVDQRRGFDHSTFRQPVEPVCGAANAAHGAWMLAPGCAVGNLDDRALGIAIDQQVSLRVHQHRRANLLRPMVIVGDPPKGCLDPANHNRHLGIGSATPMAIDNHRSIRPPASLRPRGVGIIAPNPPIRSIVINHRIHIASGNPKKQIRPSPESRTNPHATNRAD